MIKQAMDIIKLSVNHLNPGQVPVIAFDQLLFAVAKEIQWNWSDLYGEKILLSTFDNDVLILAVAFVEKLKELQGDQSIFVILQPMTSPVS